MDALPGRTARPIVFMFLVLPLGISGGFLSVTLPFIATRAGLPVGVVGSVVAISVLPHVVKVAWAPVTDLTLTLRRWCVIGTVVCAATLALMGLTPIRPATVALLTTAGFLSQVGATLVYIPVGGLMALTVAEEEKGRAAGFFQAGNLGGVGLGGGAGVWLATRVPPAQNTAILALLALACVAAIRFVPAPERASTTGSVLAGLRQLLVELWSLLRGRRELLAVFMVLSPIGIGAASNLWSAVAPDWHAPDTLVALATGVANGLVSAAGCALGGWWADRVDRRVAYLSTGGLLCLVGVAMALAGRTPAAYAVGTLTYAFVLGLCYAAYSALCLETAGRGAAASKYAIMTSLGNVPLAYMTAFDGWTHDRWNAGAMLYAEAGLAALAIGAFALVLPFVRSRPAVAGASLPPVASPELTG